MKYKFEPKQDITAYELAVVVANVTSGFVKPLNLGPVEIEPESWDTIPDEVKRHWKVFK